MNVSVDADYEDLYHVTPDLPAWVCYSFCTFV